MKISVLDVGPFLLDGGSIFGVVPREKWEKFFKVDSQNRISLGLNVVLVEIGDRKILIDGGDYNSTDKLISKLSEINIAPEKITDIIFTHLHYDHCGGVFKRKEDSVIPMFSNARYYVNGKELENALMPDERTRFFYDKAIASFLSRFPDTVVFEHSYSFGKDLEILHAPGHTSGHSVVIVYGEKMHLIAGDIFPTKFHLEKPYFMTAFDENLKENLTTKKKFIEMLSKRQSVVYFYHHSENPFIDFSLTN